ncbi:hypothetical protein [Bradyrhizobium japonicum]|uniref:hypothetical protein n=1 Tax=Bradyrhizobium japonicum TaxID=375 RepID=UPI0020A11FAA|nr:hypothetical protein [Bradyrhizobium japonicum]MCP1761945.1 hypothetical protein [Bradyrhizobium japonicum]MCP1793525.1 hypothetical protein [Bradyrhizobium japonicum]MCP1805958.1 hypothetical protein [Bradyrhizobium japonicum]MCP1812361.1 hypothetical protein [Bradyrhizobium japonicum]MCP1873596.1 hypothetical protein [Bradyrhizobium japonicum]
MADDELRMRARLIDEVSGPLGQIAKNLGLIGKNVDTRHAHRELSAIQNAAAGVGKEIKNVAVPALAALGITTGGVVLSLVGVSRALRDFSNQMAQMRFGARELGLTVQQLEAFKSAADKVAMSPGVIEQALKSANQHIYEFRNNFGSLRDELRNLGAGSVVDAVKRARTDLDAYRALFKGMEEIQRLHGPAAARYYAEQVFGSAEAARLAWQKFNDELKLTPEYTQKQLDDLEAFRKATLDLSTSLDHLKGSLLAAMAPGATKAVENLQKLIDSNPEGIKTLAKGMEDIGNALANIDPKLIDDIAGGLGTFASTIGKIFEQDAKDLKSIIDGIKYLKSLLPGSWAEAKERLTGPVQVEPQKRLNDAFDDLQKQTEKLKGQFEKMSFTMGSDSGGGGGGAVVAAAYHPGGGGGPFGGGGGMGRGFGGGGYSVIPDGGGGTAPRSFNNPLDGTSQSNANPLTGPQSDAIGGRRPMESGGGSAGITAPAGTPIQRSGMATVTAANGRKFQVDARFAQNFQGFINDYEKAGGVIGPESGTLGHRPHNASGHPIGAAIDINQIGYGIRGRGGTTLPFETEDELAKRWGLVSGHNWRRKDTGHFGIESVKAARDALVRNGVAPETAEKLAPAVAAEGKTVKGSWFGSSPGWSDPSEPAGRKTASGQSNTVPGIALPSREGLGKMFEVTTPDGRKFMLPQTDIGPAARTGRGIDITSAAATQMGYTAKNFPTDAQFSYRRIDDSLGGKVEPKGNVNIKLWTEGSGVKYDANSDGFFQSTSVQRYKQMDRSAIDSGGNGGGD